MATIEDIAKRINVSKGTVSKALNGASDVSAKTRKLVLNTAIELGYIRPTHKGATPRLVIFVTHMDYKHSNDFGYQIIAEFRQSALAAGCEVVVEELTDDMQRHTTYETHMIESGSTGAFFLGLSLSDPWLIQLQTTKIPTVLLDNHTKFNPYTAYIGVDNQEGMSLAISHLKELGHHKIGYLSGALGSYITQSRFTAFFQALRQNHLPDDPKQAANSYFFSECTEKHLPKLLEYGVTAIVCSHDLLAHTIMVHCQQCGLSVPEDISIIGFDDLPMCQHTCPPMTTIRQDLSQLGKSAYHALSSLMEGVAISSLLLHADLKIRQSSGPAPSIPPVKKISG